jgi:DNA-3-methyladenine glycosylase II
MPTRKAPDNTPDFWSTARRSLAQKDPVLGAIIRRYKGDALQCRGDLVQTLARAIVGQQISVKAADTIWTRFTLAVKDLAPSTLTNVNEAEHGHVGLSRQKIRYLNDLGRHFQEAPGLQQALTQQSDELVIARLTQISGIGPWTAEMALIFSLLRPDVLPLADLGLMKAISQHYNNARPVSRSQARAIAERWRPWRSVATWYLWRSLDPEPVHY